MTGLEESLGRASSSALRLRRPSPRSWTLAIAAAMGLAAGCSSPLDRGSAARGSPLRIVFRHQPLWGDPEPFRRILADFGRKNPDIQVEAQAIPNRSDLAHQLLVTALEGRSPDLDAFVLDVVWAPEFATAGWLADLSESFPPDRLRDDFLPGPAQAVLRGGRTFAVPWYVDVGLLYWRTDLAPRAPRTYRELERFARDALARDRSLAGYAWQGRQYEGLSCNVFEGIWGRGGEPYPDGRLLLDTPEARAALSWLRGLIVEGLAPRSVTAATEEETRRLFGSGRAVFMRNWPYAWPVLEEPGSPVRGRVGVAPLPTESGEPGPGVLGGWQLGVAAHALPARRAAAERLIAHLTSPEVNLILAVRYSRLPARRATYHDPRLRAEAPFLASLHPMVALARPRPLTPYYGLLADALQGEFSAAVSGLRSPAEALRRAQHQADLILGTAP